MGELMEGAMQQAPQPLRQDREGTHKGALRQPSAHNMLNNFRKLRITDASQRA